MAGDYFGLQISGLDELTRQLRALPDRLRKGALRNALAAGGRVVRDEARKNAPVINASDYMVRKGYRRPSTLRKAISVRTSKRDRKAGNIGVFVNVRPAKKAQRGGKNPADPFYWRWQEFGWNAARSSDGAGNRGKRYRRALSKKGGPTRVPGRGFLQAATSKLGEALQKFSAVLGSQVQKMNIKAGQ